MRSEPFEATCTVLAFTAEPTVAVAATAAGHPVLQEGYLKLYPSEAAVE